MILRLVLVMSSYCLFLFGDNWLEQVSKRVDEDAVAWMRERLRIEERSRSTIITPTANKQCIKSSIQEDTDYEVMVFVSLSVPSSVWCEISKELEQMKGTFVLRGLPENSFKEFAVRTKQLTDLGVTAPIQINPRAFTEYDISIAPTIVIKKNGSYDKVGGCISIRYALELIAEKGETNV